MRCLVLAQPRTRSNLLCREHSLQWLGEPYQSISRLQPRSRVIGPEDQYLIKLQTTDLLRLARPSHRFWAWQDWDRIWATYRRDTRAQLASLIVAHTLGQWYLDQGLQALPPPRLEYQAARHQGLAQSLAQSLANELRIWQHTVEQLGSRVQICAYEDCEQTLADLQSTGYDYREIFTNYWDIPRV